MKIGKFVVLGLALLMQGCSESIEHKLEQAKVALNSGRPDAALRYGNDVLAQQPDDQVAMMIVAKAHLRLRQFEESKRLLLRLSELNPEMKEPRFELLNLALSNMADLLGASEFNTNPALIERFTAAKELGHLQADWFNSVNDSATADYARARLIIIDSQRIEKTIAVEEARIRADLERDATAPIESAGIEELRRQIRNMLLVAERHLESVLNADPNHFAAAGTLARLHRNREAWSDLWLLANRMSERKDLPSALAAELVADILVIPAAMYSDANRFMTSRRILEAVAESGRASIPWKVMRARLHLQEGEKGKALALAQEAFRAQPKDLDVRLTYAGCLYDNGQYAMAKSILNSLAVERATEQVLLLHGMSQYKTGDMVMAAESLRRVLEINGANQIARTTLVAIASQEGKSLGALREDINKLYEKDPSNAEIIRYKFAAELAMNSLSGITALLRAVEALSPRGLEHVRILIEGHLYLKDTAKALQFAEEATRVAPDNLQAHLTHARVHLIRGETDAARKLVVGLRDKFPGSPDVDEQLAQLYLNQGAYDRVIDICRGLIKNKPDHVNARLMMAQAFGQLSLPEEALDQVKEILDRHPNDARGLEMGASIHRMTGQPDLAQAYLDKIDESQIEEAKHPGVLAQLKLAKGNTAEALAICNRAIANGSTDPRVRLTLANIHSTRKNVVEEEVHLIAYVRENPASYQGYSMLARFYAANNAERGLAQFRSLRTTNDALARIGEATLLRAMGRVADAASVLNESLPRLLERRDPLTWPYARFLATMIVQRDRSVQNALPVFDALIERNIHVPLAMLTKIQLQWNQLDDAGRIAGLKQVEGRLTADEFVAISTTVNLYAQVKRLDLALALVDHWRRELPTHATLVGLRADLLAMMGRKLEDVQACQETVRLEPDVPGRYLRLAQAQIRAGLFPQAEVTYDQMARIDTGAKIAALWAKSNMFVGLGMNQPALTVLDQLHGVSAVGDPRVQFALGQGLASAGRESEAAVQLTLIPQHARTYYPSAQILLARIDMRAGKHEQARARLTRLMEDPATRASAAQELVRQSATSAEDQSLLEYSDQALELTNLPLETRGKWMIMRLDKLVRDGNWPQVAASLEEAVKLAPNAPAWAAGRVLLMIHTGKIEDAKKALIESPGLQGNRYGTMLAMGLGLATDNADREDATLELLHAMVSGDIAKAQSTLPRLKLPDGALFASDLAAELARPDAAAPANLLLWRKLALANLAVELQLFHLAEELAAQTIAGRADFVPGHALNIVALTSQRKEMAAATGEAIRSVPDSTLGHWIKISQRQTKGEFDQAIAAANTVLSRDAGHVRTSLHLVQLHQQAQRPADAVKLLTALYESQTGSVKAIVGNDLAYSLARADKPDLNTAFVIASSVVRDYPGTPAFRDTLGWIEYLRGNADKALEHLSAAVLANPGSTSAHYHLGETFRVLGNPRWARLHLEVAANDKSLNEDAVKARQVLQSIPPLK